MEGGLGCWTAGILMGILMGILQYPSLDNEHDTTFPLYSDTRMLPS
jgi:hypothetical protein